MRFSEIAPGYINVFEQLDCCDRREVFLGIIYSPDLYYGPDKENVKQHSFIACQDAALLARDLINIAAKLDKLNGGIL